MEDVKSFDKKEGTRDTGKFDASHGESIMKMHPALYGKIHRTENTENLTGLSAINYLKPNNGIAPGVFKGAETSSVINKYAKIENYLKALPDDQKKAVLKNVKVKRSHLYGKKEN